LSQVALKVTSPIITLLEIVRDINRFLNNLLRIGIISFAESIVCYLRSTMTKSCEIYGILVEIGWIGFELLGNGTKRQHNNLPE